MLALHRTIMVVDVADFTNPKRTSNHQLGVRKGVYGVLHQALEESGIERSFCITEDRGDGAMILIDAEVPKIKLVDMFPGRLVAGLLRYNAMHAADAKVQLRVGLHFGEVTQDENGMAGPDLNDAFRILEADQAKSALRESGCVVAFIASDDFYKHVITQDAAAHPHAYRTIRVSVKNTDATAWLRLAETGTARIPAPRGPEPLWQPEELKPISGLLSGVTVAHVPTIVRRAAGPATRIPRNHDAWDIFIELMDANAAADGVPPALYFLELLTEQLEDDAGAQVAEWVGQQVRRMRLDKAMTDRREASSPIPAKPLLHLLISAEQDLIDPTRYRLSYWRQDDPELWPPSPIPAGEVTEVDLEDAADQVIVEAEKQWADQHIRVALEFLFPLDLLGLPVHRWFKERDSDSPMPLIFDYPIVLRSLERMAARYWHRQWRERWRSLHEDPSPDRVYYCEQTDTDEPFGLHLTLSKGGWVTVIPSTSPDQPAGRAELMTALQSGIPVLMWHSSEPSDGLRSIVEDLLEDGGLAELPARTQDARRETFLPFSRRSNVNIAQRLVLLWDDPTRTVLVGQPQ